ncbi:MAG: hypothetical protein OHK0039_43500 [Bacteroidia bacterium]
MGFGLLSLLLSSGAFMLLWNFLIPNLFGGPVIGFFQALLLMLLARLLFGWGRPWRGHRGCHHGSHQGRWRGQFEAKLAEKMEGMTPEEREKFRKGFTSGKWDVHVFDVEDEAAADAGDDADDKPGTDTPTDPKQV